MPYGELGHVEKGNCLCCVGFSGGFGKIYDLSFSPQPGSNFGHKSNSVHLSLQVRSYQVAAATIHW
jgi:hypothetical protein